MGKKKKKDETAAEEVRRQAANFAQAGAPSQNAGGGERRTGGVRDDAAEVRSPGRRPGPQRNLDPDPDGDRTGRAGGDPLAR